MFLHDAEYRTKSWQRRHSPEAIATHGAWRWAGMRRHQERIEEIVCAAGFVIDFGGTDGPLGLGSTIVDVKSYTTIDAIAGESAEVLFTSHCLEHIDDVDSIAQVCNDKVMPGGHIICHVPAWTCRRWRAEVYSNPNQTAPHVTTFKLSLDTTPFLINDKSVDRLPLFHHTTIELAEHCGDDSIMVIAQKDTA